MRKLTVKQVLEDYGGTLPADAVMTADAGEPAAAAAGPVTPRENERNVKRSERFSDLNTFVDMTMADLTEAETKVWMILFRDTKAGGTARTGRADIARRAGLSVRAVSYAVEKLKSKGLLKVVCRGGVNRGPSVYRVRPTGDV